MDPIGECSFNVDFCLENIKLFSFFVSLVFQNKDALARLAECFVRMHVEQITADDTDFDGRDIRNHIYNPNEMNEPDLNLMNLFKPLADAVLAEEDDPLSSIEIQEKGQQIRDKFDNIFHRIEPLNHERFRQILLQKSSRYDSTMDHRKISGMKFKEVENVSLPIYFVIAFV